MWKKFAPALLLTALASCGAGNEPASQANGEGTMETATQTMFKLTSEDFREGQPIPQVHSCDGSDQSPQLGWDDPPQGTRSLALVMDDPDAPNGTFRHWAAYDIPPTIRTIERGQSVGKQATNDFGKSGYGGPCPPRGHGPHRYRFKLYALDVDALDVPPNPKVEQVEQGAKQHQLGLAQITGTFERK